MMVDWVCTLQKDDKRVQGDTLQCIAKEALLPLQRLARGAC
jgi:hypothetical protein